MTVAQGSAEQLGWFREQAARFAQPDLDTRIERGGKIFIRNLGMQCPQCPRMFFTYQVEGNEREPFRVDRNPDFGLGMRETCGDPDCIDREDRYQFGRRQEYRAEAMKRRQAAAAPAPAKKGGKL